MISRKTIKVKGEALCATTTLAEEPSQNFYWGLSPQGFHKLAYVEWGDKDNPNVLICTHALTRNSRDFDYLAKDLQKTYRIICPDFIGRGKSDYVGNALVYNFTQYMSDMVTLLARIGAKDIHWLGTSLGGIIGMMLAAQPLSPIKSLILNDVGMIVPSLALHRIGTYARNDHGFSSFEDAKSYFQTILSSIGVLDSEKWNHITKYSTLASKTGALRLAYDPAIGENFINQPTPALHLETYWQSIRCPILVLRGEQSDFLPPDVITKMLYFQPKAKVITLPDCGHAPSLMESSPIRLVKGWLGDIKKDGAIK
ncbi:MAG: alpha/beta hydrolase [Proteobacteria bacterium]|nr:alpha/beta hydrolase [Pseudomonadota bacterium]